MKVIQKRLTQLEGAILMQNDVNNRIVHVVKNDASSQIIIDSMNEQFSALEKVLQKTIEENKSLKIELSTTKELISKQDEKLKK
jgi:regulator of replication initiation timing